MFRIAQTMSEEKLKLQPIALKYFQPRFPAKKRQGYLNWRDRDLFPFGIMSLLLIGQTLYPA